MSAWDSPKATIHMYLILPPRSSLSSPSSNALFIPLLPYLYLFFFNMASKDSLEKELDSSHIKDTDQISHQEDLNEGADLVQVAEQVAEYHCSPWTKSMFRLYGCLLITYFCGCLNGYDGSLMGGLNAMSSYQDTFNTYEASVGFS